MDIKKIEEEIVREEKIVEEVARKSIFAKAWVRSLSGMIIVLLLLGGFIFWRTIADQVKTDKALIENPIISLSPTTPGILEEIYVKVGDTVLANAPVAKIGNEIVIAKVPGIIVSVNHQEGQMFTPGTPVVSMVNPDEERVVAKIDENKGLSDIKIGQVATFTVDAFGTKEYQGVVDEISPISDQSGVVFNISDARAVQQFDVKIRFNVKNYPELKEGMSAKINIFTK